MLILSVCDLSNIFRMGDSKGEQWTERMTSSNYNESDMNLQKHHTVYYSVTFTTHTNPDWIKQIIYQLSFLSFAIILSTFMKYVPPLWAVTSVSKMIYLLYTGLTELTAFCKVIGLALRHTLTWGCFDSKKQPLVRLILDWWK